MNIAKDFANKKSEIEMDNDSEIDNESFVDASSGLSGDSDFYQDAESELLEKELIMGATVEVFKAYWPKAGNSSLDHVREVLYTVKGFVSEVFKSKGGANEPAVSIEDSVQEDYLVCLNDGRKLKVLKRYLKNRYGMSIEAYKEKWGLPDDYPVVAPKYSKVRQKLAVDTGLGHSRKARKAKTKVA